MSHFWYRYPLPTDKHLCYLLFHIWLSSTDNNRITGLDCIRPYMAASQPNRVQMFNDTVVNPGIVEYYLNRMRMDLQTEYPSISKSSLLTVCLYAYSDSEAIALHEKLTMHAHVMTILSLALCCQRLICGEGTDNTLRDVMTGIICIM